MPQHNSFLLDTELGRFRAYELWRYARGVGLTPHQALQDPHLGFNLSVMRGHDKMRSEKFAEIARRVAKKDSLGVNRIYQALRLLYEDD